MAFMGRGGMSFGSGEDDNTDNDMMSNRIGFRGMHGGGIYLYGYVPLDNTYVMMQMIVTFIILIVGGITFLATYKSPIVDPIENTKSFIIYAHLILTVILLFITIGVNFLSKSKEDIIRRLIVLAIISITTMLIFVIIKIDLDSMYNASKFEEMYLTQETQSNNDENLKVSIGFTGVGLKTEKQYYVDECVKLYNIFKIKSYGTLSLNLLLTILIIFQISRLSKNQNLRNRVNKDDVILFDEEENVKF